MQKLNSFVEDFLAGCSSKNLSLEKVKSKWMKDKNQTSLLDLITTSMPKRASKKPPKDPNAPKGHLTAYFCFCAKNRQEAKQKKKDESLEATETAILGSMWSKLTDKQKAPYKKESDKDLLRYNKEMEEYKPSSEFVNKLESWHSDHPEYSKGKGKKSKPKDPEAPKKPSNAFFLYIADKKGTFSGPTAKDKVKSAGSQWKKIKVDNTSEYKKYVKKAEKLQTEYNLNMKEYSPSEEFTAILAEYNATHPKTTRKGTKKDKDAPKAAKTTYNLFCAKVKAELAVMFTGKTGLETKKEISEIWKNRENLEEVESLSKKQRKTILKLLEEATEEHNAIKEEYLEAKKSYDATKAEAEEEEDEAIPAQEADEADEADEAEEIEEPKPKSKSRRSRSESDDD